jgi:uncharacterized membrane protein
MTTLEPHAFAVLAIAMMAAVTFLLRAAGYGLMAHVALTPRVRRMLDAMPGSIVAATVLPLIVKSGPTAAVAIIAGVAIMVATRSEFLAVAAAVLIAAVTRYAGL